MGTIHVCLKKKKKERKEEKKTCPCVEVLQLMPMLQSGPKWYWLTESWHCHPYRHASSIVKMASDLLNVITFSVIYKYQRYSSGCGVSPVQSMKKYFCLDSPVYINHKVSSPLNMRQGYQYPQQTTKLNRLYTCRVYCKMHHFSFFNLLLSSKQNSVLC